MNIKVLFKKYLNNESDDKELEQLLAYFQLEEKEDLLKQLILEDLQQESDLSLDAKIDERLLIIHQKIKQEKFKNTFKKVRLTWFQMAAAAMLILVGSVIFYLNEKNDTEDLAVKITQNKIVPGKNQAVLTLADGSKISLSEAVEGEIALEAGVRIVKTADGQLVYQFENENPGAEIQYNTIESPAGGQWKVVLPDQSAVWLNAKSSLTFPTTFRNGERKVELVGEAYFEISPDKTKPFKVLSKRQSVVVLGTHFNVMAYPEEQLEKTTLMEGKVNISAHGLTRTLKPGEQARTNSKEINITDDADLKEAIAWKNGYFKFNENLEGIMSKISRWYDVEVVYVEPPHPDYTFEGEVSRTRDLNELLKIMEYTGKVHFDIDGRRILVRK